MFLFYFNHCFYCYIPLLVCFDLRLSHYPCTVSPDRFLSTRRELKHGGHSIVARGLYALQLVPWLAQFSAETQSNAQAQSQTQVNSQAHILRDTFASSLINTFTISLMHTFTFSPIHTIEFTITVSVSDLGVNDGSVESTRQHGDDSSSDFHCCNQC